MKDEDPSNTALSRTTMTKSQRESSEDVVVGKRHYKFWVITAILLLALWSMFTGSLTLKSSAANFIRFSHHSDSTILNDIDVLEVEEREKMVRRMWDVYTHSSVNRLPRFWSEAFQAAYEHLVSDVRDIREAAVTEIAKMSLHAFITEQHSLQPEGSKVSRKMKQAEKSVDIKVGNNS